MQGKGTGLDELYRISSKLTDRSEKLARPESKNVFICMLRGRGTVQEEIKSRANDITQWVEQNSKASAVIFLNSELQPNNKGLLFTRAQIFGPEDQSVFIQKITDFLVERYFYTCEAITKTPLNEMLFSIWSPIVEANRTYLISL